jgi:hypothetical protein
MPGAVTTGPTFGGTSQPLQPIPQMQLVPGPATPGTSAPQGSTPADIPPKLDPIPSTGAPGGGQTPLRQTYPKPTAEQKSKSGIQPLPDPEAEKASQPAGLSPRLKPGDQTAERLLPHRWAAAKINWPENAPRNLAASYVEPAPSPEPPAPRREPPAPKDWYDSGWLPANP